MTKYPWKQTAFYVYLEYVFTKKCILLTDQSTKQNQMSMFQRIFPLDFKKKKLKGSLFKCQNIPNRKTFCYMAEFQTNFENPF